MEDLEDSAKEELKRADHLIYVTLKYTRTSEVIKNTIKRLISAFDYSILEVLEYLKRKKKIKIVPSIPKLRAELLQDVLPETKYYIEFYFLLKQIDKSELKRKEEYRKNVALVAADRKGIPIEINIETLKKYYDKTHEFIEIIDEITR
jgi:glycerophosphoryl diester phosphodiesterase